MSNTSEKLTRLKHLSALATRTKAELTALDNKIQEIVTVGGQPNVIEEIQINGVKVNPSEKVVNLIIATKVSELANDSKFQSDTEVQALISAAVEALKIGDYAKAADLTAAVNRIADIEGDYLKVADKTELQGNIDTLSGTVTTLIGEDAGKSARTIANEELAKQLIAADAKEALDTLAEIAAWIQSHPEDASAMHAAIEALQAKVDTGDKTVSAYVTDAINALAIGDYAKVADLNTLAGRVKAIEDDYLKAADKYDDTVLAGRVKAIEDDYLKASDKTELQNAINGVDAKFANYATTEQLNGVDAKFANYSTTTQMNAAIKVVDDKFSNYTNTTDMNAAIKAVDDKFAGYYTSAQIDGMIATDDEVNAAITAAFGS